MALYWKAVDPRDKKQFASPREFAIKTPGLYHPKNPFPGMVIMMNSRGYRFELAHDDDDQGLYFKDYPDITEEVYQDYLREWPQETERS